MCSLTSCDILYTPGIYYTLIQIYITFMKNPPCWTHYRTFHPRCKCNSQTTHKGSDGWNCSGRCGGGGEFVDMPLCANLSRCYLSISQAPPWGPFSTVSVTMVSTVVRMCFAFLSPNVFLGTRAVSDSVNALQSQLPWPGLRWGQQSCCAAENSLRD